VILIARDENSAFESQAPSAVDREIAHHAGQIRLAKFYVGRRLFR